MGRVEERDGIDSRHRWHADTWFGCGWRWFGCPDTQASAGDGSRLVLQLTWIGLGAAMLLLGRLSRDRSLFARTFGTLASWRTGTSSSIRAVMLHIGKSAAASFAGGPARRVHSRSSARERERAICRTAGAAHNSIDQCQLQPVHSCTSHPCMCLTMCGRGQLICGIAPYSLSSCDGCHHSSGINSRLDELLIGGVGVGWERHGVGAGGRSSILRSNLAKSSPRLNQSLLSRSASNDRSQRCTTLHRVEHHHLDCMHARYRTAR